jgi:hypothetical protein
MAGLDGGLLWTSLRKRPLTLTEITENPALSYRLSILTILESCEKIVEPFLTKSVKSLKGRKIFDVFENV